MIDRPRRTCQGLNIAFDRRPISNSHDSSWIQLIDRYPESPKTPTPLVRLSPTVKTLRRFQELRDPESLRLFGWSLLTVFQAATLLRTKRLPALLCHLARSSHPRTIPHAQMKPDLDSLDRIRRYSHAIVTNLLRSKRPCLLRSLVLYRYCWKRGLPASIHFGVRSGVDGLEGHSWVTLYGAPLGESAGGLRPYVAIYSYPADAAGALSQQAVPAVGGQP